MAYKRLRPAKRFFGKRKGRKILRVAYKTKNAVFTKRLMKRMVSNSIETKTSTFQFATGFGGLPTNINTWPLSPYSGYQTISQGVGEADRIGNVIKLKRAVFKYTMYPLPYNASTNQSPQPQHVRIWFYSVKFNNTFNNANPPNFVDQGNSSGQLAGALIDFQRKVNNDNYTYYGHRDFKLGFSGYQGTGSSVANQYFMNNDYALNRTGQIDITKWMAKRIIFNDTDNNAQSRLLVMTLQSINSDGSSQTAGTQATFINWQVDIKYADA